VTVPLLAIVGRPNVGKSTLFNKLVGGRPALVHDTPHLTRDRRYGETDYFGKVYNIKPASTNRVANILIAQGFLVGSSRFQNEDADFINRIILGHGIPANVIPQ